MFSLKFAIPIIGAMQIAIITSPAPRIIIMYGNSIALTTGLTDYVESKFHNTCWVLWIIHFLS